MRKVGSRELKNRLGRYLALVKAGQVILVTDRGETVAKLSPVEKPAAPGKTMDEILQEMAAAGHLRLALDPGRIRKFKPIRLKGKPLSRMIIEDRD
jgi:prevent-host-death family protein